ncbi:hypothetical protein, partial [Methanobrevibacter sp. UBA188]
GPSDFVEVEKVDDGDVLEKPIDVSEINPSEFFEDDNHEKSTKNEKLDDVETVSEFVAAEEVVDDS